MCGQVFYMLPQLGYIHHMAGPAAQSPRLLRRLRRACHENLLGLDLFVRCPLDCLHCRHASPDPEPPTLVASKPDELLGQELDHRRSRGRLPAFVAFGASTEPFPSSPEALEASVACLKVLLERGVGVSLETRCAIPQEALETLAAHARLVRVRIAFFSARGQTAALWEPSTSDLETRLFNLRILTRAQVPTAVHLGPILPTVNEDPVHFREILATAAELGLHRITTEILALWPGFEGRVAKRLPGVSRLLLGEYLDRTVLPPRPRRLPPPERRRRIYDGLRQLAREHDMYLGYCRCVDPEMGRPPCNLGFGTTRRKSRQLRLFSGTHAATRKSRPSAQPDEAARVRRRPRTPGEE